MKKILCLAIAGTYLFSATMCHAFSAKCLNEKGKFSKCVAEVNNGMLTVQYKSKKWRHLDRTVRGDQITALTGGEYARRRVAESVGSAVLLGPLFLFVLFSKKKRDNFGVEYINDDGSKDALLIQLKKKYGFAFGQQLKTISGKEIVMQDKQDKDKDKGKKESDDKNTEKVKNSTKK